MADHKVDTKEPSQAIPTLAEMIKSADPETMRAGKRQLWELVRHVGRPGNTQQVQVVVKALVALLSASQSAAVTREALWAISELGGSESVAPVAALLADKEVREDACMVLERLPGDESTAALQAALKNVPEEFAINVAHSLRARGIAVEGLPCQKLTPTRQTSVTPVEPT
ncbi:MAG: HEAT repeat domain-containing protein [Pirellulaceae bacterium]